MDPATADFTSVLIQYGAVGLLALVSLFALRILWAKYEKTNDEEVKRGDRLEKELLDLHKLISDRFSADLVRATEALKEVAELLKKRGDR